MHENVQVFLELANSAGGKQAHYWPDYVAASCAAVSMPIVFRAGDFLPLVRWLWVPAFAGTTEERRREGINTCGRDQCTLTVSSSWLQALAIAASRLSVSMIGVPSAACSENSCMPG